MTGVYLGCSVTQRFSAAERRAQIVATTRAMIADEGARSVTLRAVARRCGMTAPGIKHHFSTMTDLYREVIDQFNDEQNAIVEQIATAAGDDITLIGLADALAAYYSEHSDETRNFDLLEAEAMAPDHPAHGLYPVPAIRPLAVTRYLAERDYEAPEIVVMILSLAVDGLRFRWLQKRDGVDIWADWLEVRDELFSCFAKKPSAPPDPPLMTPRR
ncbi:MULTISPECIES: TetR/AcrR family transcriptional regulator [Gordonia]|uniref:TetR/AcrR family transcriptional regulator n=1 Tax=Gordonia oleivorans TaxID=3156618 RepID=UPI0032B392FB